MNQVGPTFLVLGAQKAGTNSLLHAMAWHPQVWVAGQELHYFDLNLERGADWYRSCFAPGADRPCRGESSPYYLFHPAAPERVKQFNPELRLLVILRDPVERAIAHYHHARRLGFESLPIQEALAAEPARLRGEAVRLRRHPESRSFAHQHHSYLSRGLYLDQLANWLGSFPREQFLVIESGDLYRRPREILSTCWSFLGLPPFEAQRDLPHLNAGYYSEQALDRAQLASFFAGPNESLFRWWGHRPVWTAGPPGAHLHIMDPSLGIRREGWHQSRCGAVPSGPRPTTADRTETDAVPPPRDAG